MDQIKVDTAEAGPRLVAFATTFLPAYTDVIDRYWPKVRDEAREMGALHDLFPLYGRTLGDDVAIAACRGFYFNFYFVQRNGVQVAKWADRPESFDKEWQDHTPEDARLAQMRETLELPEQEILYRDDLPGDFILASDLEQYKRYGSALGDRVAGQHGERSVWRWPNLKKRLLRQGEATAMANRYQELLVWKGSEQRRGQLFEKLWRDCLNHHGWHARKIRISGEDNDFTAIYKGLHIVGEVKWHAGPMNGNNVREFLAKLDPRPQSIGMYVSHSGIDPGAASVMRRSINSKTVLLFDRDDIEKVLLQQADPGSLFDEKLREAYDKLFEES